MPIGHVHTQRHLATPAQAGYVPVFAQITHIGASGRRPTDSLDFWGSATATGRQAWVGLAGRARVAALLPMWMRGILRPICMRS